MSHFTTLTAAGAIAMTTSAAFAQDVLSPGDHEFVDHGNVGAWTIYGDKDRGTCLIEGVDDNGNVIQMGLTAQNGVGYVGVFTKQKIHAHDGKTEDMTIVVNENVYTGKAHEMKRNVTAGYQGGYVLVNNAAFVEDLKKGYTLTAWPDENNGAGIVVDLTDSYKAIEAAADCNKKMGAM